MIRVIQPGALSSVCLACCVFEKSHVSGPRDDEGF
jgi:hypothetical protein